MNEFSPKAKASDMEPPRTRSASQCSLFLPAQSTARLEEIVEANTTHKVLGIFGEEAVNVLGVNLAIAQELGLIGEVSK